MSYQYSPEKFIFSAGIGLVVGNIPQICSVVKEKAN